MALILSKSNPYGFNVVIDNANIVTINEIDCGVNEGYMGEVLYSGDTINFYFETNNGDDVTIKLIDCDTGAEYLNEVLIPSDNVNTFDRYLVEKEVPGAAYNKKVKIEISSANENLINGNVIPNLEDVAGTAGEITACLIHNGYEYVLKEDGNIYQRLLEDRNNEGWIKLGSTSVITILEVQQQNNIIGVGNRFFVLGGDGTDAGIVPLSYTDDGFQSFTSPDLETQTVDALEATFVDMVALTNDKLFLLRANDFNYDHLWSNDGGTTWFQGGPCEGTFIDARATKYDENTVFITALSGTEGRIFEYTYPLSAQGTLRAQVSNVTFYDIKFKDLNDGYAVGYNTATNRGVIYKTTDGGANWSLNFTTTADYQLYNVFFSTLYIIVSGEATFVSDDNATSWNINTNVVTDKRSFYALDDPNPVDWSGTQILSGDNSASPPNANTFLYSIGQSFLATSEIIEIVTNLDCTKLITYSNNTDFNEIKYLSLPNFNDLSIRIRAQFWKRAYEEENESFEKSDGSLVRSFNQKLFKRKLETHYMPNYMHDILNRVLMHDNITIDGVSYIKRDEYEHENINRYNLSKAAVWLTEKDTILKNVL